MKSSVHIYKVAGHLFGLSLPDHSFNDGRMQRCYAPFEVAPSEGTPLFNVIVCDRIHTEDVTRKLFTGKRESPDSGRLTVFSTREGWLFGQTQPYSENANALIRMDGAFKEAEVALRGNELQGWLAFNSAVMLCYLLATAQHDTLLTHSSCVVNDGKAYLFLGKSGTGKSTHSSLWLKHITGTTLLNDDHPIVRISGQGEAIAYGSPWSGKTPCYRNDSAPVGGIVRIRRAMENSIVRLGDVQAYASLTAGFSGMTWEARPADSRHETIARVVGRVPCYTLGCLPDEAAARVCHAAVTDRGQEKQEP